MALLALELTTWNGLPVHPLIVHLPVMLVPLALIGAILALAIPRWRSWLLPLTAIFTLGSVIGVQLAIMSGEGLEEISGEEEALIERHSQLAEQARPMVFLFFVLATLAAVAYYLARRDAGEAPDVAPAQADDDANAPAAPPVRSGAKSAWARALVPLCALSIVTGALATTWVYRTGHTGAQSVWEGEGGEKGEGGEGGEKGEKTEKGEGGENTPQGTSDEDGDDD